MVEKLDFLNNVTRIPKVYWLSKITAWKLKENLVKYNFSKTREPVDTIVIWLMAGKKEPA